MRPSNKLFVVTREAALAAPQKTKASLTGSSKGGPVVPLWKPRTNGRPNDKRDCRVRDPCALAGPGTHFSSPLNVAVAFYPEAQIHKWPSKECRSLSKKIEFGQAFVQKLLVESGCRMSQRRDDFLLIALASGQPWRFAHHCRERRPRARPTSTSGPGCGCAARCWQ